MELLRGLALHWLGIMYKGLIVLGPMTALFWILKPQWLARFRISQPRAVETRMWKDLPRTALGLSVYMIPVAALVIAKLQFGYSRMYLDIAERGWCYFFLSMVIFAIVTDTWFYWAHRLMHRHPYFVRVHRVHHRSYNVTPAAAYSFDLVEALINMFPYLALVLVVPWHPLALSIFGFLGMFYVGYIHLGYDFAAQWRSGHPIAKWFYSSTHHSRHHQRSDCNYAVYFTFWDKVMRTEVIG